MQLLGCTTSHLNVTARTLEALCSKLGVPLAFIDAVLNPSIWSKQSGASFHRHDAEGTLDSIGTSKATRGQRQIADL